jgi:hypothetical protein
VNHIIKEGAHDVKPSSDLDAIKAAADIENKEIIIKHNITTFASFNDITPDGRGRFGLPILSIS